MFDFSTYGVYLSFVLIPAFIQHRQGLFFLFLSFAALSCNESLPPHDPVEFLQPHIEAEYVVAPATNGVAVSVKFINVFDETLQGRLGISGKIELAWKLFPDVKKVIDLNSTNLSYARNYNGITGELTLAPGDSVIISCLWSVMADSEAQMRNMIFLFEPDSKCGRRRVAHSQTFTVTGEARIFRNNAPMSLGQTDVSFCAVTNWVGTNFCPPLPACDL